MYGAPLILSGRQETPKSHVSCFNLCFRVFEITSAVLSLVGDVSAFLGTDFCPNFRTS